MYVNRKEEEVGETEQQQTYQFTKGFNILYRLQVHHLTLTFIIRNEYISTLYNGYRPESGSLALLARQSIVINAV